MSDHRHQLGDTARGPTPRGVASTATVSALPFFSALIRRRRLDPSTTLDPSTEVAFTLNQHTITHHGELNAPPPEQEELVL